MTVLDDPLISHEVEMLDGSDSAVARALFAEARQRRIRRRLIAAIVIVVFLVASTVALVDRSTTRSTPPKTGHRIPTSGSGATRMPSQLVVLSGNDDLEVISSKTGRVVRRLATRLGLFRGTNQPSVSRSGIVYFDNAARVNNGPSVQIFSAPLSGGPATFVAFGHKPVVSPDGRRLAYLTWTDLTDAPDSVVVMNLQTRATSTWQYAAIQKQYPEFWPEIDGLSWSANSQFLAFTTTSRTGSTWANGVWALQLSNPDRSLLDARPIPLHPNAQWEGYVSATQGIEVRVQHNFLQKSDWFQPVVIDVSTGRVIRRLPIVSGDGGGMWIDPSGRFLALQKERVLPNGMGTTVDLYRWSIGSPSAPTKTRPTLVKRNVWSAAWVP